MLLSCPFNEAKMKTKQYDKSSRPTAKELKNYDELRVHLFPLLLTVLYLLYLSADSIHTCLLLKYGTAVHSVLCTVFI
jgi:hypothetical protein